MFPRYRLMGLNRNSGSLKFGNEQRQRKLSEYSMGSRANDGIMKKFRIFTRVCRVNQMVLKDKEKVEESQHRQS